ncbi:MAG: flagellar hook protein FlgE [Syntrophaceticus sp.]|jgi:flagellar hook protein FlgE|nr:flagellar hook protein FlgE [Syntrophaceticus sp.]MDD3314925.1 flagellar hook protein FlgE [Syntrophaceticus sp.]MDD4360396.1 flagellar hook protein FlgE [Syntrophaceticus sp.]MDD4783419.1 flagellar hook protein FlgE [Syntrophaceticus sp.]
MMSSLFAAVSGLKAHQERMDVVGNNIANVNTTGFKKSRVTFADMLYHTSRGASRPVDGGRGGINPMQKGPGVSVASIDTIFAGSNLQDTGKETDLGISGDGFFIVSDGQQDYFTRAGNFNFDEEGNLVSLLTGMRVQGWTAVDGDINSSAAIGNINIPTQGLSVPAKPTTTIDYAGNLDAGANGTLLFANGTGTATFEVTDAGGNTAKLKLTMEATDSFNTYNWSITSDDPDVEVEGSGTLTLGNDGKVTASTGSVTVELVGGDLTISPPADGGSPEQFTIDSLPITIESLDFTPAASRVARQTVCDSLGDEYTVTTTFTRVGNSQWDWAAEVTKSTPTGIIDITPTPEGSGTITIDASGKCSGTGDETIEFTPDNGALDVVITPHFQDVTQYADKSSVTVRYQDGYKNGSLQSYNFDNTGTIVGVFSNGTTQALAQIALANFSNPAGLSQEGDSMFSHSSNSGQPVVGESGIGGLGAIRPGSLESSNVDIASEFTDLIITQRGFQANSRVITTSDEMLQELVNLKR